MIVIKHKQELLKLADTVYTLESQLDDAYYSVPEYPSTAEIASSVDTCRETLYEIKQKLEEVILAFSESK